jgi:putative heme-binding domain-containing protein
MLNIHRLQQVAIADRTPFRTPILVLASLVFLVLGGMPLRLDGAHGFHARPALELRKGDRISLIGNTLADRMQHDGWLEVYLHSRFPEHELTIRHLGFSGDELTLRLRSADFGTPDEWLRRTKADVVLAFFGYNESFGDLDRFRRELADFIDHTLQERYNGLTAPRLVLFSPIAHENLRDPSLPDGRENNERLERFTQAMAEVAHARHIPFVDLFHPTRQLYAQVDSPLTINGIHLTAEGNRRLAEIVDGALFGDLPQPRRDHEFLARLRQAVLDKNFHWFHRYRTVDGYSIYGGRADLRFVNGQTNREVMQREMEILEVMTANRDRRIWALAQGQDLEVDDQNTPPFIPVTTNKPGPGPNGEHFFLDGNQAIERMTLGQGLRVNLFASEKEFPDLVNPVQMTFDNRGRLWVAVWPTYPHWKPKEPMDDKILIFEDTDGDGVADRQITFADHLHCPTGFEIVPQGVLVAQAPDLMLLKDLDGDDRADFRERVLSGLDSADTHHTANSFRLDPGGALYFQEGTFHHTQVETPYGPPVRLANAGVFRYEPRSQKFEVYITYPFANPHGHVFDRWGQDFVTDGTGNLNYFATAFSGHLEFPEKHREMKPFFPQRTRPCPGTEILSSRHFPEDWQGHYLVANVIGFQGIHRYKILEADSGFTAEEQEPVLFSSDPNFRPSDLEIGPDGALYFLDWQNPIIGHMQHNLRDPSRDRSHGRVYRVTYKGRDLLKPARIAGAPIAALLELLKEPEDRVRERAKVELGRRDTREVLAAVKSWVDSLPGDDPEREHHLLEALWVHQFHDVINENLLTCLLQARDGRARAAATRVLCSWRHRIPDALAWFRKLAADPHPRVRLEAVRAASFFQVPEAMEIVVISAAYPSDYYLEYTRGETMRALEPTIRKALAQGRPLDFTSPAGARFFLSRIDSAELLRMKRDRNVLREILVRKGIREEDRRRALAELAGLENRTETLVLIHTLTQHDSLEDAPSEVVALDLARLLTDRPRSELISARSELALLATTGKHPSIRQFGIAGLIAADGDVEAVWELLAPSPASLRDLLSAIPWIRDPALRAAFYPKIEPLLRGLPPKFAPGPKPQAIIGRYVRIELPRPGTLTLAEVEVYSDGRNVAPQGKATQINTFGDGDASRAIDGNTSGVYSAGGQTHTQEMTTNPWWELDLGSELPIDSVVVFNRTEALFSKRLDGFTIRVLDASRNAVFQREGIPAPEVKVAFELGGDGLEGAIRRAAMNALASIRGQETSTVRALSRFVHENVDRRAAILALQKIPTVAWPPEEAAPLLQTIIAFVRRTPVTDRTSPEALEALQLADSLTTLLPPDRARDLRRELADLGVRVIRVGTVLEQMRYDVDRIVVQAGRPVEILFENVDMMPHNFVVTKPGALEEVGLLAEATATQPDAAARQYVPISDRVLLASRLLQPRETQRLSFTAPSQMGVYPYVCTYPGHWRRMYGAIYVVEDLDEYLASPESYLASHAVPIADELLKSTRPRTEWQFDDLAPSIAHLEAGRSYSNGKQLFQLASCISCHRMEGTGQEFGPDLTRLDPKPSPAELLQNILEPSAKINDKYAAFLIELDSGQVVSGLIVEETPEVVKIVENPLASTEPRILSKAEILSREKAPASLMPKGLLDKLTREEILDLIAYITSGGDPAHPLFQGNHNGGHHHGNGHSH